MRETLLLFMLLIMYPGYSQTTPDESTNRAASINLETEGDQLHQVVLPFESPFHVAPLSDPVETITHTLHKGDTLTSLSDQYRVPVKVIAETATLPLIPGTEITIPEGWRPLLSLPLTADITEIDRSGGIRITQTYSDAHQALDFAGPLDNSVVAVAPGVVRYAGYYDEEYGNLLVVDHDDGYSSWYAHLSQIEVELGEVVETGSPLALMGQTGCVTGIHLHFEIRYQNRCQNPLLFLHLGKQPIASSDLVY